MHSTRAAPPSRYLLILGCSGRKREEPAPLPALMPVSVPQRTPDPSVLRRPQGPRRSRQPHRWLHANPSPLPGHVALRPDLSIRYKPLPHRPAFGPVIPRRRAPL